ncbi:MAG: hypothetical protein ACI82A_004045 [Candidatus Azotimanducaceae bacterium]|jgi:hypothetical protein
MTRTLAVLLLAIIVSPAALADDTGLLVAQGFGTADGEKYSSAQGKMLARRAAITDGRRNLLEVVEGVRITSGTTVKDLTLEKDEIGTRVKGMLRGSFVISENVYEDSGSWVAEVEMAFCMSGGPKQCERKPTLAQFMQPELKAPAPEEIFSPTPEALNTAAVNTPDAATVSTGLIVDASAQNFSPMLDVRMRTQDGKELYGPGHVTAGTDWLHWARSVASARDLTDIVGASPLVVTVDSLGQSGELVVGQDSAIQVFQKNLKGGDFLKQGKVIFVVN